MTKKLIIETSAQLDRYLARLAREGIMKARLAERDSAMGYYIREQEPDEEKDKPKDASGGGFGGGTATPAPKKAAKSKPAASPAPTPPTGGGDKKTSSDSSTPGDVSKSPEQPEQKPLMSPEAIPQLGDVSYDMIKDKLNVLRAGQSLREPNIGNEMQHYYNELSDEERLALWKYLNGISSILAGTTKGVDATDPDRPAGDIAVTAAGGRKPAPQAGTRQQRLAPKRPPRTGGVEDTMAPVKVVRRGQMA